MDEEQKQLLRRIVENLAWRQLAVINILGHSLKFVGELEPKQRVASELDFALRLFREVHGLYDQLGWKNLDSAVREQLVETQYPASRAEFGLCFLVTGIAEVVAMENYVESTCPEFAAIARSHVAAAARRPEPKVFLEFASDPSRRPQAQEFLDRWVDFARRSFGRPGTAADRRAVELGLRKASVAEMEREFERRLGPFLERTHLRFARESTSLNEA